MTVRLDRHDDVALITLDDGKANVAGPALLAALDEALDEAEPDAGAVVLAGRPGMFSGGFDLKVLSEGDRDEILGMLTAGADLATRWLGFPLPTVVACTGHAVALGALLLLAGDTRIGERGDYNFTLNETRNGMPLPPFGVEIVRARLDPRHVTAFAVQSQPLDVDEAQAVGVLGAVVEAGSAVDAALETAGQLAALPSDAYRVNKQAFLAPYLERIASQSG